MKRHSRLVLLSCLIMTIIAWDAPARADPIQISGGRIAGTIVGGVQTYKGIPYAKPPVGDLRWRPPQPIVPWSGTLIADEFSPICVQPDPLGGHSIFTAFDPKTESVLYFDNTIERGPIPNQKYYAFWDAFAAGWKGPK